jgi:hypothetical protein
MKMFVMAGLVFAADVAAVVLIVLSLWLENWFGLHGGVILDFIFIAAICYGVAGWIVGKLIMLEFPLRSQREKNLDAIEHPLH